MSPPVTANRPASCGRWPAHAQAAVFDAETGSLAVLSPGPAGQSVITPSAGRAPCGRCRCPGAATAMTGDDDGRRVRIDARRLLPGRSRRGRRDDGRRRRAAGDRLHRDRAPRGRQAGARQRRRRRVHPELGHRGRRAAEDLRAGGCPCHARQYRRRAGPRTDIGDHGLGERHRRRPCTARRRGCDHDGRRRGGTGAGRRHARRRAAGVRHRPADPSPALSGAATRPTGWPDRRRWPGCRRRRRTPWLATIWPPASPSRRCAIEPCSSRTPWSTTKRLAPCMWCRARERVSR